MTRLKYFFVVIAVFFFTDCRKSQIDINPLILGDWQLFQVSMNSSWIPVPQTPPLTINFTSKGKYSKAYNGSTTCSGTFVFINRDILKMNPQGCMAIMESEETIYTLSTDTLIISDKSLSFSSSLGRKDKYIKIK